MVLLFCFGCEESLRMEQVYSKPYARGQCDCCTEESKEKSSSEILFFGEIGLVRVRGVVLNLNHVVLVIGS